MFKFVDEEAKKDLDVQDEDIINQRFYEFSLKANDYFLHYNAIWDQMKTECYYIEISKNLTIGIPSGFYIMVSDEYGSVDWIQIDEIIGRPLQVACIDPKFSSWSLNDVQLVEHSESETFFFPNTKNIFPVTDDTGKSCVMISKVDNWSQTKDMVINEFTV